MTTGNTTKNFLGETIPDLTDMTPWPTVWDDGRPNPATAWPFPPSLNTKPAGPEEPYTPYPGKTMFDMGF